MKLKEKFQKSVSGPVTGAVNAEEEDRHSASDAKRGAIGA